LPQARAGRPLGFLLLVRVVRLLSLALLVGPVLVLALLLSASVRLREEPEPVSEDLLPLLLPLPLPVLRLSFARCAAEGCVRFQRAPLACLAALLRPPGSRAPLDPSLLALLLLVVVVVLAPLDPDERLPDDPLLLAVLSVALESSLSLPLDDGSLDGSSSNCLASAGIELRNLSMVEALVFLSLKRSRSSHGTSSAGAGSWAALGCLCRARCGLVLGGILWGVVHRSPRATSL
jgi:hypothetical protein